MIWRKYVTVTLWIAPTFPDNAVYIYAYPVVLHITCLRATAGCVWCVLCRCFLLVILSSCQTCSIDLRKIFYCNRIVDAYLPNTVFSASSTNNFKMKLREVNLGRFLTIVELYYSYLRVYFFGIVLYFMCVLAAFISVAVWPFVAYLKWNEMK